MSRARALALAVCALVGTAGAAAAQNSTGPDLRPGRLLVGVGGGWTGADALGGADAAVRQAATGTAAPPTSALFKTDSEIGAAPAAEAALTLAVTRAWAVEVRGSLARPTLTTTITADVEASGTFTATERLSEYVVDASAIYHLGRPRLGARTRLFVLAGGGYLRQLHEDNVLVDTGATWHVGAGARLWLRGGDRRQRDVGLTGEVRWMWRKDGIAFDDGVRSVPTASLRFFVRL